MVENDLSLASPINSSEMIDTSSSSFKEDPISVWNTKRNEKIKERDAIMEKKHSEIITQANTEIETFYKTRAEAKERKFLQNQEQEKLKIANNEKKYPNEWAKATEFVDFKTTPGGKDTSRLKKLMIDLKNAK